MSTENSNILSKYRTIPQPELRPYWGKIPLVNHHLIVTSVEVAIICPGNIPQQKNSEQAQESDAASN